MSRQKSSRDYHDMQMCMGSGAPLILICSGIYSIDKSKGCNYFGMISLDYSSGWIASPKK